MQFASPPKSVSTSPASRRSDGDVPPLDPDERRLAQSASGQFEARSPNVACNKGLIGDEVMPAPDVEAWRPRESAAHVSLGANGIYYFRLVIPAHVRALNPSLPRELKRSTKTTSKRLALARARKMCLDFSITPMHLDDVMPAVQDLSRAKFSISIVNGSLHGECSVDAGADSLLMLARTVAQVHLQTLSRVNRSSMRLENSSLDDFTPSGLAEDLLPRDEVVHPEPPASTAPESPAPCEIVQVKPDEFTTVPPPTLVTPSQGLWLSEAIERWRSKGGAKFSDSTWTNSYAANFRVFRELVGKVRRPSTDERGQEVEKMLDLPIGQLTRAGIEEYAHALTILPPNQGQRAGGKEAWERITEGEKKRVKPPSNCSVDQALTRIQPFLLYAKQKTWISQDILDEFDLAIKAARATTTKADSKANTKSGAIALTDDELRKLFAHPSFTNRIKKFDWRFWIPLLLLHQGLRVSEASQLHTDDILYVDGVLCISLINGLGSADEDDDEEGEVAPVVQTVSRVR
jgi:hypothetical protein